MAEPLRNRAWSVPLVGRTGPRAALRQWVADACGGSFRLAAISGPTGIGKSRLLDWTADEMRRRGALACIGRCAPGLSHPLGPIIGALGALGARVPLAATPAPDGLEPAAAIDQPQLGLVRALADQLLREAADRPVLLALEDIQWAGPATLSGFEQLAYILAAADSGTSIAVALTHRPLDGGDEAATGVLARLAREPAFRALTLDPLSEVEVYELMRRLAPDASDPRLARHVYDTSHGNPLVAIVATDEAIATGDGRHLPGRPSPTESPDDLLARRYAQLSAAAVWVVRALAVGGGSAPLRDVAAIADLADEDALCGLDELERAHLVRLARSRGELTYSELGERALQGASSRERWALHGRMADLVAARPTADDDLLELAHHLERAGPTRADELDSVAAPAADQAFAAGAWADAAHLYEIALDAAPTTALPPREPRAEATLEELAGIACFRDFDADGCIRHLDRAADLAGAAGDPATAARAALWLVRRSFTSGTAAIGRSVDVAPIEALLAPGTPAETRAQAHGLLAEVAFQANDLPRAREHAEAAVALAEAVGDDFVRFTVAIAQGLAHLGVLDADAAAAAFAEADACTRRRGGQPFQAGAGAARLAATEVLRGDLAAAERAAATGGAGAQHIANWADHALAHAVSTIVAGLTGRFDDQEDHAELSRISCGRSATTFPPLVLHPAIAWGRAARGDVDGALAALGDLDAAGGRSARYAAAIALTADDPGTLGDLADHEWRAHPDVLTAYDAGAHAAQLELAVAAGARDQVAAALPLFEDLHRRGVRFVLEWPALVSRLIAEAHACLGHVDAAGDWLRRARSEATAAGARPEVARLDVVEAGLLLSRGEDGAIRAGVALIEQATASFDALGMLPFVRRAQRLFDLPPAIDATGRRLQPRTVLFTDIVDSTAWNVRLGDDHWLVLLAEHNRLARQAVREWRGAVVKTTGDGICAWFADATDAIDCAASLQGSFDEFTTTHPDTPIALRCGLAVGDVFDFDGDLAGLAVTEAARICAVASGGQVVTSAAVVHDDRHPRRRYREIGSHLLKGIPEAQPLYEVSTGDQRGGH
ncbi:MAG TPA: AAA family ATPase [Acidimicrobiales bacterium]|nr:AAA family ATPase [Acidimicrobiales bacterium]